MISFLEYISTDFWAVHFLCPILLQDSDSLFIFSRALSTLSDVRNDVTALESGIIELENEFERSTQESNELFNLLTDKSTTLELVKARLIFVHIVVVNLIYHKKKDGYRSWSACQIFFIWEKIFITKTEQSSKWISGNIFLSVSQRTVQNIIISATQLVFFSQFWSIGILDVEWNEWYQKKPIGGAHDCKLKRIYFSVFVFFEELTSFKIFVNNPHFTLFFSHLA